VACGESNLTCQLSFYPLGTEDYERIIAELIAEMKKAQGLEVEGGPMSTFISGPQEALWELLKQISQKADQKGEFVFSLTVSNVCGGGKK